jgi:ATP-binding cassette, subfamily B (MDR/TAP), member 1
MASLLSLCDSSPQPPATGSLSHGSSRRSGLRKIVPGKCHGEVSLHDVTFSYPSRPSVPVLEDISLYLPAGEMTFIVGGSGSGKSTIAQLLLRMYTPQSGAIHLDDQDLQFLDDSWTRHNLAAVSQECVLFDMSVHDNVALGVAGSGHRTPSSVSRAEVLDACTAALIHDFVKDLPDGYDTQLGNSGTSLSGGQKQRLAIARAKLRNPPVLILGKRSFAHSSVQPHV